uniref:Uncharacterized protein n=1 Tax=Salmonella phage PMBT18 TaxID=3229742 RepID=A0AB39BZV6_9CAUD
MAIPAFIFNKRISNIITETFNQFDEAPKCTLTQQS